MSINPLFILSNCRLAESDGRHYWRRYRCEDRHLYIIMRKFVMKELSDAELPSEWLDRYAPHGSSNFFGDIIDRYEP